VQRLDRHGDGLELGADLVYARGDGGGAECGAGAAAREGQDGAVDPTDHLADGVGQIDELIAGVNLAPRGRGREVPSGVGRHRLRRRWGGEVQHGRSIGTWRANT